MNISYKKKNRGQTIIFALVMIIVMAIFTPTLVNLLRDEVRWSVKHKRSVGAFHLAEAAVDRGYWKLKETADTWDDVALGNISSDYQGGKEFADVDGGTYKIWITTTNSVFERKIIGVGREATTNEMRAIEMLLRDEVAEASLQAPSIYMTGAAQIHWGPIMCTNELVMNGAFAARLYPKKYSVGQIAPRDSNPALPNSDELEWWSYYPVPDPPGIDFDYYKSSAIAQGNYYAGNHTFNNDFSTLHTDPDSIYYVEGNCVTKNSYLKGALIVLGNWNMNGNGKGAYNADVPVDAWEQYQAIDLAAPSVDYPGDAGFQACDATYPISRIVFEGFVYVGGDGSATGNPEINGAVQITGDVSGMGNVVIWYKDTVLENVVTAGANIRQIYWKEIKPVW